MKHFLYILCRAVAGERSRDSASSSTRMQGDGQGSASHSTAPGLQTLPPGGPTANYTHLDIENKGKRA